MNNKSIVEVARGLTKKGFSVIPVDYNKIPEQKVHSWRAYQNRPLHKSELESFFDESTFGIALLTGGVNKLTCIDFDTKYHIKEGLYESIVSSVPSEIFNKMKIQRTRSGGYHWLFSCDICENNMKLASRETTDSEVMHTFASVYTESGNLKLAMRTAANDKTKVLIETRGIGGYILIAPTPGYEWIQGTLNKISPEEYRLLMDTLRSFNEYFVLSKSLANGNTPEGSPLSLFNANADGVEMLVNAGWKVKDRKGKDVRLLRPGVTHQPSSAVYDTESKLLNVYSTSTSFEVGRAYSNADILMELENVDLLTCVSMIRELGYGK